MKGIVMTLSEYIGRSRFKVLKNGYIFYQNTCNLVILRYVLQSHHFVSKMHNSTLPRGLILTLPNTVVTSLRLALTDNSILSS